jgi:hypothetical protein
LGRRASSITAHLVKRVLVEHRWAFGTTAHRDLDDLRRAARLTSVRLALYERRGGSAVVLLAATEDVLPPERRGHQSLPLFVVVYSADRGIIVSGYQASELAAIAFPGVVQWLT